LFFFFPLPLPGGGGWGVGDVDATVGVGVVDAEGDPVGEAPPVVRLIRATAATMRSRATARLARIIGSRARSLPGRAGSGEASG
jgi:hypothetical protein